ncbi:nitroreductase family deazaflavin-dependent oxidoreductase [Streptomyces sp. NPDC058000]|uniref:nitroreductase family deazaflavin-dependent oxidoreductase n=1 Tax=Streptomyces sp. NPDC058000 TaxID=3346299 RepID=UPI0036E74770
MKVEGVAHGHLAHLAHLAYLGCLGRLACLGCLVFLTSLVSLASHMLNVASQHGRTSEQWGNALEQQGNPPQHYDKNGERRNGMDGHNSMDGNSVEESAGVDGSSITVDTPEGNHGNHSNQDNLGGNEFNRRVIEEFRANGGVVGGPLAGQSLLLLTTTGARSGLPRTTPACYLADADGRFAVFPSNGGAATPPAWYRNLTVRPEVTVEVGVRAFRARATEATGATRDRLWDRQIAADPQFAAFQDRAGRRIPVVVLTPLGDPA